ncbi:hypothetical protein D9758_005132 [Tetrapyrgos nigripes]|uniref:Uncharacterized protein n=1 Tax=Tetrapyrgos nigripes TaxID=182062 RepID=A0A8H5GWC0_9AGAR|nr:hypothetical protein D9758_005132 [Tetrapyrgos nigripes]
MTLLTTMSDYMPLPIELIEEIINYVVEMTIEYPLWIDTLTVASRRDLLSCALSCSAFFRPSMKILWCTTEFFSLLKLLPGLEVQDGFYILGGKLDEAALERFDIYSSMVKTLVYLGPQGGVIPIPVDKSVFTSLALLRPRPLLSLTHVYTYTSPVTFFEKMMVSPVLEYASFKFCRSEDIIPFLSVVKDDAPTFRSLTLENYHGRLDLASVSQLQNLQVFDLDVRLTAIEKGPVSHPRSLKQLDLQEVIYDPSNVLAVLRIYRDSDVESFSLEGDLDGEGFKTIFSMVSSQWSRSMTTLSLDLYMLIEPEMGTSDLEFLDVIRPLHSLYNVELFTATWSGPSLDAIYLTDTVVSSLCNGWRNLIHFVIRSHRMNVNITLASLKTLSGANCLSLKRVSIPFDVVHVPSVDHEVCNNTSLPSDSSHQLEFLTLIAGGKSDLDDFVDSGFSISLAYHLDTFFPFLKDVHIMTRGGEERVKEVMDIIRRRQDARRRERSYLTNAKRAMPRRGLTSSFNHHHYVLSAAIPSSVHSCEEAAHNHTSRFSEMSSSVTILPTELVDEIFSYSFNVPDRVEALTRQSRRDFALVHGAVNTSLISLLKLLPGFGFVLCKKGRKYVGDYRITGLLNDDSLQSFDLYASTVKRLIMSEDYKVHPSVYTALASLRPRPLPSLIRLRCGSELFTFKMMFMISPCLQSAVFEWADDGHLMKSLSLVKEESPLLHSLVITRAAGELSLELNNIAQLRNLRVFDLSVRKLVIEIREGRPFNPSTLKQLVLREALYDWEDIIKVVDLYRTSGLQAFSLEGGMPREKWELIFGVLSAQQSNTLTKLSLDLDIRHLAADDGVPTVRIDTLSDFLRPLYRLNNLQMLCFSFNSTDAGEWHDTCITDTVISDICHVWPNLVNLEMLSHRIDSRPTLVSLQTLSTCCPRLKQVSLPFDISNLPSIGHDEHNTPTSPPNTSHQLESMIVVADSYQYRDLLANGSASLAYHLDATFPHLKDVSIKVPGGKVEVWHKVLEVIRLRQDARVQAALGN